MWQGKPGEEMIDIPEKFAFQLYELVDKHTFETRGVTAWSVLRQDAIYALHGLRTFLDKPITINTWFHGGNFQWSGYRSPMCTIGAAGSEHRKGNAFDCKVKDMTAEEVRKIVLENQDHELLSKIQRIEADVSWFHFDLGYVPQGRHRIYVFKG